MYSFKNDYSEGAHPKIMAALAASNLEQTVGYGLDPHCENAAALIKKKVGRQDVDVHFLVGGTQTNLTVIAAALRPYQAVISAKTGHICVHETGAIEASGHKCVAMETVDGKLTAARIKEAVDAHGDEHMVQPKMVYLSQPTELGTIYTKAELMEIRALCDAQGLYLFIDGARLACAITAAGNDVSIELLAQIADVFYLGGTKAGALFGEALVIVHPQLKPDFRYMIKQRGGMLAKGRLLGIQFETLFSQGLYEELGTHANQMAGRMKDTFLACGYAMLTDSPTNQQFVILPDEISAALEQDYAFEYDRRINDRERACRFVTSWATPEHAVTEFAAALKGLGN